MTLVTLDNIGEHIYTVPLNVYAIDVTCIGKNGTQSVQDVIVAPGQEISYYVEAENDSKHACAYFGPYVCAQSDNFKDQLSRIELVLKTSN